MHVDVIELRKFYYHTRLGAVAKRALRDGLQAIWPDVKGQTLAGFGFAAPILRPYMETAQRAISLMPAGQGAFHWPAESANMSVLCDERHWPLGNGFVDRLLLVHALETSERPRILLNEAHRVLAAGGRAIIVVPNRSGLWAASDATPFGHGRPYSLGQLEALLREHALEPEHSAAALYAPPSEKPGWLRVAGTAEKFGRRIGAQRLAGAILIEAVKTAYAAPRDGAAASVKTPAELWGGLAPQPRPATGRAALARRGPPVPARAAARESRP